ncbi:MAG: phosphotransferase [Candidatus Hodarchaeales archaeon]|jgi:aminoglycoside phosphotransferase family enzyme
MRKCRDISTIFTPEILLNPSAYDYPVKNVVLRNTPFSWVFLSGDFAYKVKKPVVFGDILDFSTLELRRKFCEQEIILNSRFSSEIYINTFHINQAGQINGSGKIIEYGIKMKRLPEEYLLVNLLQTKQVTFESLTRIAEILAEFHESTKKVPEYGNLKFIGEKWDENFRTTATFRSIDASFREKITCFLRGNRGLFRERINDNRITDNHGDFQARNIFLFPNLKVIIFDCVEFSSLLRYGDVAEDVGFLAMDLDFWNEKELSDHFVKMYIKYSGDDLLLENLDFFKCYRAYVRGKVYGFQAVKENASEKKNELTAISEKYYNLAYEYSEIW